MESHDWETVMKQLTIAMVVALGVAGGAFTAPTAQAQTLYETLNLARDAEAAAKKVNGLADHFQKLVNDTAQDGFPSNIAPVETEQFRQRAEATVKALRRQGRSYELMAIRLRDHARTLR